MAENDIVALKELASGGFLEVALAPADISAAAATHASSHHTGGSDPLTPANIGAAQAVTVIQLASDETNTITTAQLPARGIATSDSDAQTFVINLPTPSAQQSGLTFSIKRVEGVQEAAETFFTVNHASVAVLNFGELDSGEGSIDFLWDGHAWSYSGSYSLRSFPGRVLALPIASGTLALTQSQDDVFRIVGSSDATKKVAFEVDGLTTGTTRTLTVPNASGRIQVEGQPIGDTTPAAGTFTTLAANNGTLTASAPVLDLSQTWNNAAVAFTGFRFNATNTASAAASNLIELQVGGSTLFSVNRAGNITFTGPMTSTGGGTSSVATDFQANSLRTTDTIISGSAFKTISTGTYEWSSTTSRFGASDLILLRDAADTLAQRRGTSAQTFRLYNTFTDASNHERGFMRWSSNVLQIGTEKAGTGSARALEFQTDGVTRMTITTGGSVTAAGTLTGGPIQSNSGVRVAATSQLEFGASGSRISNQASGVLTLHDSTLSNFDRLQFGGTTSSFPALKRSSTALQVRLANDSDFAPFECAGLTLNGDLTASTRNIVTDTTTGTKIGTGTTQKIGFFNATPVIQQSSTGTNATGFTANGPTNTVHADSTFTGNVGATAYSISDIVKHLKTMGLIAS